MRRYVHMEAAAYILEESLSGAFAPKKGAQDRVKVPLLIGI